MLFWLSLSFATALPRADASASLLKGIAITTWTFAGPFAGPLASEGGRATPLAVGTLFWLVWCSLTVRMALTRRKLIASAIGFLVWSIVGFAAFALAGLRAT